ncbi:U2 small nuclear ribonucleoprotein auxiliary factor 35 kDa subunit-related protein 1-like [Homarus americanus]|uniref:U2 small nuclear ribonucleoprotein auxiliary factor 35 kDa subunit-related protein 1-like n=1 Tax=Homarus americanus TaxID=6706 RepID=A0A8J5MKT1_HOMAM|nr:U2 small nuclear ribonucleoprotein auxiliary factor 35 kDa subunit-related protein 1-like [Homarus americanus]
MYGVGENRTGPVRGVSGQCRCWFLGSAALVLVSLLSVLCAAVLVLVPLLCHCCSPNLNSNWSPKSRKYKTAEKKFTLTLEIQREALLRDPVFVAELERIEARKKRLGGWRRRRQPGEEKSGSCALIKKEWEEKQRKEKEEEERKKEEQGEDEVTHNPEPPPGFTRKDLTYKKGEPCPFFTKTGACRFGLQCSREHDYPESSQTILLPNMYTNFGMEQMAIDGNDADIALEYTDSETYENFRDFFEDTLPEFQHCGNVIQFKVCANTSPHLRGNVYVQYTKEEDAVRARTMFNGRWYAGRQLTCLFVTIERWKSALCGQYEMSY